MAGASQSSVCSQSSEVPRVSPRMRDILERQGELAAGNYPESDLPVQRVNYSEAEDLKIQLAEANKQTKT